jgi:cell division protein FtsI/penicillin-binding protein 2
VEKGVFYNACSLHQLEAYGKLFAGKEVSIRINPGLGSGSTQKTDVGGATSSFGIWYEYMDEVKIIREKYNLKPTKISKKTAEEITSMLVTVMDKSIKGGNGKLEHFSVAVKTGTAQVADSTNGGYYADRHTHSFFGYFPAYDPKFIVFLYAVNPKGVPYAATTWADPFLDITKFLLNYYEVPPDR